MGEVRWAGTANGVPEKAQPRGKAVGFRFDATLVAPLQKQEGSARLSCFFLMYINSGSLM
jgi:hypothetical protein